ncbi:MAG: M48 family metallopeptidase [Desulfocapsaceae bacterium]|nr:M48 family metallopeptidase [Desulfocapsaceae bacterium]
MKKLSILITLFLLAACAVSPTGRKQLMLVSPEQAITASKSAYVQTLAPLQKSGKLDADPQATARVRQITGRIIAQTIQLYPHTRNWQWDIRVIDDPENVNAWCMAGGKMAVYTGLLKKIEPTDDELAQVIGHEIAHAVANHTAEKMSVALASQLGLSTVAVAAGGRENSGATLTGAALAASLAIQLPNSRTAETEADRIGIELAARAGYNPYSAVSLWEKMAKEGGSKRPQFLSTHPAPQNRMATLRRLAPQMMPYYQQPGPRPIYTIRN